MNESDSYKFYSSQQLQPFIRRNYNLYNINHRYDRKDFIMQEMNYQSGYRDEPPVPTYESVPPLNEAYDNRTSGQKLTGFVQSNVGGPSATLRLVLAIISLLFWMGMFLFVTFGVVSLATSDNLSSAPKFFISVILISGMLLFTGLVVFLNVLFNRSKR